MKKITLLFLLIYSLTALSQAGTLDVTFNLSDSGFGNGNTSNTVIYSSVTQPDGKIIVCGNFTTYMGISRNRIARLNSDLSLDTTFDPGTGANNAIQTVVLLADSKILIGGSFTTFNGTSVNRVARLNIDGSLDSTFIVGTGTNNTVNTLAIQSNGKILMGGNFTTYNSLSQNRIARLNADGTLDSTFNVGTGANANIHSIKIQSDGMVLLAGSFTTYNSLPHNRIVRLNTNGSIDSAFTIGSGFDATAYSIAVQLDGKIIVAGMFSVYNGTNKNRIVRLNSNGDLDNSFNFSAHNFTSLSEGIQFVSLLQNGKILIGNRDLAPTNQESGVFRLNTDGSVDPSFTVGYAALSIFYSVEPQLDGTIVVVGSFTNYNKKGRNYIVRLNDDGTPNTPYNLGTGANGGVTVMQKQTDGKIIIGGGFVGYNGVLNYRLARISSDGTLDSGFNTDTGADGNVLDLQLQSDGKIIISGMFNKYRGTQRNAIARLNSDGSLDAGFSAGFDALDRVNVFKIQSDGKIVAGGGFESYGAYPFNGIIRLNSDGSLDTNFNSSGTGANGVNSIYGMDIQQDGKIIIGGDFTAYNGVSRNNIARLNTDGTLDTSFNSGNGGNTTSIDEIIIQPDGKILIAGPFTSYNNFPMNGLARLNTDGSLDTSFVIGTGFDNPGVFKIKLLSNGKLLIGGSFTNYNGTPVKNIVRLNSDGSLDNSFVTGSGADNRISEIELTSDNKILIGGLFTSYNGVGRNRIALLDEPTLSTDNYTTNNFKMYPNPVNYTINFSSEKSINFIEIYTINGQKLIDIKPNSLQFSLDVSQLSKGIYLGTVTSGDEKTPIKIIKE
ncbi:MULTISPECIES: T9SS type A sorting domain-containing protein [unclassified Flavobacterium]|uniref:T9SS type A sorting domain-containing protein n=1 Tax=unclassified Flavobacterium TaxID=196869 RepID=UPI003610B8F4